AIVQFIQFGATDAVGGTFGNFGSGVLTFTVICMVYFMHHFTRNISQTLLLFFALLPLFLNETKISFILIPMTILFITIKPNFKNVVVAFGGAAIFFLLFN